MFFFFLLNQQRVEGGLKSSHCCTHAINVTDKFTLGKKAVNLLKACTDKPTAQAVKMKPPSQAIIKFFFLKRAFHKLDTSVKLADL